MGEEEYSLWDGISTSWTSLGSSRLLERRWKKTSKSWAE